MLGLGLLSYVSSPLRVCRAPPVRGRDMHRRSSTTCSSLIYLLTPKPKNLCKRDRLCTGVDAGVGSTRAAFAFSATGLTAGAVFFLATAFLAAAGFFFLAVAILF